MANTPISIRTEIKGGRQVVATLREIGHTGETVLESLERSARELDTPFKRFKRRLRRLRDDLRETRRAGSGFAASIKGELAAAAGAFGAFQAIRGSVDAFSSFEKGLVAVGKTADMGGKELEALGDRIMRLGRTVPVAHDQLLEIAASAAQLGVKGADNIERFTKTVAQLGLASNLQGEEAASTLARLLTVSGEDVSNVDRLGSVIVDLGNNFAATEVDIASAAQRVAQAGAAFGLASKDAAAIGTALKAVGVSAELGGSGIGRMLGKLNEVIRSGSAEEVAVLSRKMGVSARPLRDEWAQDPRRVFQRYVEYLGQVQRAGGDVAAELNAMGLKGTENLQVFGALAKRSDVLAEALDRADAAWKDNAALAKEAATASKSFSAQMGIVGNYINEVAVAFGRELAPVLIDLGKDLANFIDHAKETGELKVFVASVGAAFRTLGVIIGFVIRNFDLLMVALGGFAAFQTVSTIGALKRNIVELGGAFAELSPYVTGAASKIKNVFAGSLNFAGGVATKTASTIKTALVVGFTAAGRAVQSLIGALRLLWATMLANPITALVALIAAGILAIIMNWDSLKPYFTAFWNWLSGLMTGAWNGIVAVFQGVVDTIIAAWDMMTGFLSSAVDTAVGPILAAWDAISTAFEDMANWLSETWDSTIGAIIDSVKSAIEWMRKLLGLQSEAASAKEKAAPGYASGGAVRGPGTGTSDSIFARLSNGEFVMRAAAVRRYGVGMMHALNSMRLPKFADGGLVSLADRFATPALAPMPMVALPDVGGGGRPITLVLDGQQYRMQADAAEAGRIERIPGGLGRAPRWQR